MEYNLDLLTDTFRKINIELSDKQISQFIKYYEMLVEKNKVMNLTAITEYEDVIIKHFADSLLSYKVIDLSNVDSLPFIKVGGKFVSYKAANIDEELNNAKNAIKKLGGNISNTKTMELPNSDEIERNFVIIDKISKLSNKYPRKSGIPSREPLS